MLQKQSTVNRLYLLNVQISIPSGTKGGTAILNEQVKVFHYATNEKSNYTVYANKSLHVFATLQ